MSAKYKQRELSLRESYYKLLEHDATKDGYKNLKEAIEDRSIYSWKYKVWFQFIDRFYTLQEKYTKLHNDYICKEMQLQDISSELDKIYKPRCYTLNELHSQMFVCIKQCMYRDVVMIKSIDENEIEIMHIGNSKSEYIDYDKVLFYPLFYFMYGDLYDD